MNRLLSTRFIGDTINFGSRHLIVAVGDPVLSVGMGTNDKWIIFDHTIKRSILYGFQLPAPTNSEDYSIWSSSTLCYIMVHELIIASSTSSAFRVFCRSVDDGPAFLMKLGVSFSW